jgi:hypothetical protein
MYRSSFMTLRTTLMSIQPHIFPLSFKMISGRPFN